MNGARVAIFEKREHVSLTCRCWRHKHPRRRLGPRLIFSNVMDKGIAQRQAASRYLHDLAALGALRDMPSGKEKLFIHPKLMQLLSRDSNQFQPYA